MQKKLIATAATVDQDRVAGSYQGVWEVTINGHTGVVIHSLQYDKRDIVSEELWGEEAIANAIVEKHGDCDPGFLGFCDTGERIENQKALQQALDADFVRVC